MNVVLYGNKKGDMIPDKNGEWVAYEDYLNLKDYSDNLETRLTNLAAKYFDDEEPKNYSYDELGVEF